MKFDKANGKVKVVKEVSGLVSAIFEHEIKESKAVVEYKGPKISEEEWDKVLAFFAYSYKETHSEAQVRGFVNPRTREWKFWAFPQICGTGMTTKEIEEASPEREAQRAQFSDAEGWIPFGTVHHHCGASAFQSSTDESDEVRQDGLHITVGKMDEKKHDLHCRFYISGNRFDPDMSLFWEIGDVESEVPAWARKYLPATLKNDIARNSMCIPPMDGTAFPDEWKANLIDRTPPRPKEDSRPFSGTSLIGQGANTGRSGLCGGEDVSIRRCGRKFTARFNTPADLADATKAAFEDFDTVKSLEDLHELFAQALDYVEDCSSQAFPLEELIIHCRGCDVTLEKFVEHLGQLVVERDAREEAEEAAAEARAAAGITCPNGDDGESFNGPGGMYHMGY